MLFPRGKTIKYREGWFSQRWVPQIRTSLPISIKTDRNEQGNHHYCDVKKGAMASQITSLAILCSTVYSDVDQRKHQSSASLAFVWRIHRWLVNSPHKWSVTWKMFPFDDVIMISCSGHSVKSDERSWYQHWEFWYQFQYWKYRH